ncbi:hypothetical protein BASA60_005863 [Batrachochytrium salamandrivorans]|nr:hypothetical protein BASA60_005863 [Batrachochytrium salamandrivorans]
MKKSGSTKSLSSNSSTRGVKAPQLQHHLSQSTLPIPAPTADASQQQSPSSSFWASPLTMHKSIHSKTNLTNDMHPPRISGNTASHSSHPLSCTKPLNASVHPSQYTTTTSSASEAGYASSNATSEDLQPLVSPIDKGEDDNSPPSSALGALSKVTDSSEHPSGSPPTLSHSHTCPVYRDIASHTTPSRQSPVAIFWDIENCAPPNSVPGYVAVNNIRKALLQFGPIQQFRVCSHRQSKYAADKMIMVDMLSYVMDTPTPATIVLISGDRDFVYALAVLRNRNYNVVLIVPNKGASPVLLAQATTVLEWRCDIFDAEVVEKIQRDREESMMRVSALARSTSQLIAAGGSFENLTAAMCGAPIGGGSYSGNDIIPVKRDVFQTFSSIDINSENRSASLANDSNGGMHMYSPHEPEFFDVLMEVLHLAKQSGISKPSKTRITTEITARNPTICQQAGVHSIDDVYDMAVTAGLIRVGGVGSGQWISVAHASK